MRRVTMGALMALVLFGTAIQADEKAASKKPPVGEYKRTDGKNSVVLTISSDSIKLSVDSPGLKVKYETDYAVTSKGNHLYGRINKVTEGDKRVDGDVFGFDYEAEGDLLVVKNWRGSGAIGFGALFMNGNYKKGAK